MEQKEAAIERKIQLDAHIKSRVRAKKAVPLAFSARKRLNKTLKIGDFLGNPLLS